MRRIAGLVQLKTGDAVSGIVTRLPWSRYVRVENPQVHDAGTQTSTKADGKIFIPKINILFIQQMMLTADERLTLRADAQAGKP